MTRLQSELLRLYLLEVPAPAGDDIRSSVLIDASNRVRAMVIELTRPPSWEVLGRVWRGVQTELALPAPAIAVSGTDGLQLWFSLAEPISAAQAHGFVERLQSRFLPDIDADRVRLMPAADGSAQNPRHLQHPPRHAALVPALQARTGNWSAFVAPDLAPVFDDTPWLDIPPSEEGQAALLRGLHAIDTAAFEAASRRLGMAVPPAPSPSAEGDAPHVRMPTQAHAQALPPAAFAAPDPKRFLLRVMNDQSVSMALRIEAAKALLPCANDQAASPADDTSRNRV